MKTAIRLVSTLALAAALMLAAFAGGAAAQDDEYPTYPPQPPTNPAPVVILDYDGPFSNMPGGLAGEPGDEQLSDNALAFAAVDAAPAAAGTGGGDALAFTGSSTVPLLAGGFGLVLAGGAAVIASRRRD